MEIRRTGKKKTRKPAPTPLPLGPARELSELEKKMAERSDCFKEFCAQWRSPASLKLLKELARIARHREPVMILGPTGSGKTKLASCIHELRWRGAAVDREDKFKQVNMANLSPDLLHSELFGYRRGAFTGANQDFKGLIMAANGGTLFLDEVADADAGAQAALLRFLDSGKIRPTGATQERPVDVRVISATNKDPQREIRHGVFRPDLYFRLAAVEVEVPPLCERLDDIDGMAPAMVVKLGERYADDRELLAKGISPAAVERLKDFGENWSGNVRQLESVIVAGFINCGSRACIDVDDLPPEESWHSKTRLVDRNAVRWELERYLGTTSNQELMRDYARALLICSGGNKHQAARTARIAVTTLNRWLAIPEDDDGADEETRPAPEKGRPARSSKKKRSSDAGVLV
jgi:two-component system response regulator GlrR